MTNKEYCVKCLREMGLRVDGDIVSYKMPYGFSVSVDMNHIDHLSAPNVIGELIFLAYKCGGKDGREDIQITIKEALNL